MLCTPASNEVTERRSSLRYCDLCREVSGVNLGNHIIQNLFRVQATFGRGHLRYPRVTFLQNVKKTDSREVQVSENYRV